MVVSSLEEQLKEFKVQRKELEQDVEQEKLKKLFEIMKESNLNLDDVMKMIKS